VKQNEHLFDIAKLYYEYLSRHTDMKAQEFRQLAETYFESQSKSDVMTTYDRIVLEGKIEGEIVERKTIIRRALLRGRSIADIADFMELPVEEVEKLATDMLQEDYEKGLLDNIRAEAESIENVDIDNSIQETPKDDSLTTEGEQ
jgi:hypothetical protein